VPGRHAPLDVEEISEAESEEKAAGCAGAHAGRANHGDAIFRAVGKLGHPLRKVLEVQVVGRGDVAVGPL